MPGPAHTGAQARESRRGYQRQLALRATWCAERGGVPARCCAGRLGVPGETGAARGVEQASRATQRREAREPSCAAPPPPPPRKRRSWSCPLEAIAASVKAGPLVLLKEAFSEQSSVLVITRHRKGIRGRCTGEGLTRGCPGRCLWAPALWSRGPAPSAGARSPSDVGPYPMHRHAGGV